MVANSKGLLGMRCWKGEEARAGQWYLPGELAARGDQDKWDVPGDVELRGLCSGESSLPECGVECMEAESQHSCTVSKYL